MVFLVVEGLVPGASLLGNTHLSFGFIPKGFHWGRIMGFPNSTSENLKNQPQLSLKTVL